ncbi:MAG TPA: carbohydrate porin [Candidatus Udaeobacter sp.]|jgi:high affinity Mn2+ porin|nr:carbohydrate porin [Candidatus Udaeobacter sp.]
MQRGRRFFVLFFVLVLSIARLRAQAVLDSQPAIDQNISLAPLRGPDLKAGDSNEQAEDAKHEGWSFHVQGTEVVEGQPGFHSPYQGTNSLRPDDNFKQSSSFDLFIGVRLWPGGEFYVNPEYYQGFGLSNTHGIAAFPNAESYKVGQKIGDVFNAHMFLRQTFGFGGEQEELASDQLQLAERVDISRLTFTIGRLSVGDQFDTNAYAHSSHTQFLNWVLVDNGAFDYAADSVGVIEGATVELNQKTWALRYGIFDVPRVSNGFAKDGHFLKAWQQMLEVEKRYSIADHPGKVRLLGWLEDAHMGSYRETLDDPTLMEDITKTRRYRFQYGFGLNAEQEISEDLGAFLRVSWRDGEEEVWQFTDIDRSLSAGLQLRGTSWNRSSDTVGIAGIVDGISSAHRDFLAAGGLGPLIGDGKLPHYSVEGIVEIYYNAEVIKNVYLGVDYQFVANPGYNSDRGPVNIFSSRFHFQF